MLSTHVNPSYSIQYIQGRDVVDSVRVGGRETELAGDRAARVLPSVFALAEGCVSALATDSANSEDGLPQVLSDRQRPSPTMHHWDSLRR